VAGSHVHFMSKPIDTFPDLDALRLTPEQVAELQKSQKSWKVKPAKRRGIDWYLFPARVLDAVGKASRQNHTPAPLILTLVLCEIRFKSFGQNPVKLTTAALAKFSISRKQKLWALKLLEETGYFTITRQHGKNPIVRMNWLPVQK
jgi:hypothetical protein